jgi:transposase-like protein
MVCQSLLADLQSRACGPIAAPPFLDGLKALHQKVTQMFGSAGLIHRCQVHKLRNILEHLPESAASVDARDRRARLQAEIATARRLLQHLARRSRIGYLSAAASVREGLDETLTVVTPAYLIACANRSPQRTQSRI